MKKSCSFISLLLVLLMTFSLISTSIVYGNELDFTRSSRQLTSNVNSAFSTLNIELCNDICVKNSNITFDSEGNRVEVVDLNNDDIIIWIYDANENLISTNYLDRDEQLLYQKYNNDCDQITQKHIKGYAEALMDGSMEAVNTRYIVPAGSETGATIVCNGTTNGIKNISVFGEQSLITGGYYVENQTFHDFAAFVAELCLVLSSPGFVITPFANMLITAAGLTIATIDFFIYVKVRCNNEYVTWTVFDNGSSRFTTFTGMKYCCEEYLGQSYSHDDGTGNYFAIGSLRSYNSTLVNKCYTQLFGTDTVTIDLWSNVW